MHELKQTRSGRPSRRFRRVAAALLATTLLAAAACGDDDTEASGEGTTTDAGGTDDGGDAGQADNAEVLGEPNAAEGEPVKIGFASDGRGAAIDNTHMLVAAEGIVEYINDYQGGIAGRPIELVSCETQFEPGKATECANELVQAGVAAVLMPESGNALQVFEVMKANGIPTMSYGVGDSTLLLDTEVMFSLVDPIGGLADNPISIAEENDLPKVTVVVVDVPSATAFYQSLAASFFEDAGLDFELVAIPPDQADMTPQMTQIANGGPTGVHIVGHDTFCISAINGLFAAAFDGPISMLSGSCDTDAVKTALGDKLEGVYVSSATANGDPDEPGIALWNAIIDEYDIDIDAEKGLTTFITVMSMRLGLEDLTGEVTPQAVTEALRSMDEADLPGGGGVVFRCNGKARELMAAVCSNGNVRTQLDADGNPTLPWKLVGDNSIPD